MERMGKNYNDYELLYLISLGSEEALNVMFTKYKNLIITRIIKFNIIARMRDDYFQEGLIALNKAIHAFRDDKKMSFTNFFDLVLQRHYCNLLRKNYQYHYNNLLTSEVDPLIVEENNQLENDEVISSLSDFEKLIWNMRFKEAHSIKEISEKLDISLTQVYSAIARIKQKIKKETTKKANKVNNY